MAKTITIKSEKDLVNFLDNVDDAGYLEDKNYNIAVRLNLKGENFNSSLTGGIIIGLAAYQQRIYRIYLTSKYGPGTRRRITAQEAKFLEIKVTVGEGSTDILIELLYKTLEGLLPMIPAGQGAGALLGMAGIIAGAAALIGIGSKVVKEAFKTRRRSIEQKAALAKDETEKKKYEILGSVLQDAIEGMRSVSLGIAQTGASQVSVNNKPVAIEDIRAVAQDLALEKLEAVEEQTVITGTYRIQRVTLDFKKDSAFADIFDTESGDPINGLVVQPKSLSDGSYRVLKNAQEKNDVKLQLIVTKRNNQIYKAVLDKILE